MIDLETENKFIELVKQHEYLYAKKFTMSRDSMLVKMRKRAWKEIAKKLKFDAYTNPEVEWKRIRKNFQRKVLIRKKNNLKNLCPKNDENLSFLIPHMNFFLKKSTSENEHK